MRIVAVILALLVAGLAFAEAKLPETSSGGYASSPATATVISSPLGLFVSFSTDAADPCAAPCAHTLSWTAENATGCSGSQLSGTDFTPDTPTSGDCTSGMMDVTTSEDRTYTLTVEGPGGPVNAIVAVNVGESSPDPVPASILYFDQSVSSVSYPGANVTLSWTAFANDCTGTNFSTNPPYYGSSTAGVDIQPVTQTTTYTLTCLSVDTGLTPAEEQLTVVMPTPPTNLTLTPGDGEFTASWVAPADGTVASYEGAYVCGGGAYPSDSAVVSGAWNPTGLDNDVICSARVRAINPSGSVSSYATNTVTPTASVGSGDGSYTVYDDYTLNIHSSAHPICNPATAATDGVALCDGFEDGAWIDTSDPNGCTGTVGSIPVANDGWRMDGVTFTFDSGNRWYNCPDNGTNGADFDFAHYRASPTVIDTTIANYGIAGTRGVGSLNWLGERSASTSDTTQPAKMGAFTHNVMIQNSDPLDMAAGVGLTHYYVQWAEKVASTSSMMCDCNSLGGWDCPSSSLPSAGACPQYRFADFAANGLKGWEQTDDITRDSGLHGIQSGRWFYTSPDGMAQYEFCQDVSPPLPFEGQGQFVQNQISPPIRTNQVSNGNIQKWWVMQAEVQMATTPTANDGYVAFWLDDCGYDGLQCSGTPTLAAYYTGVDNYYDSDGGDGSGCDARVGLRAIWWNFWEGTNDSGHVNGEKQFDEIVVVNGANRGALNPIPFIPIPDGLTVTP